MKTKKDLESEIKQLKTQLEAEQKRPTGHNITDCHIDMSNSPVMAIAKAAEEGMKALQQVSHGNTYGMYFELPKDQ